MERFLRMSWLSRSPLLLMVLVGGATAADGSKVFTSADGSQKIPYMERLPAKPAEAKLGLIVMFHGRTGDESSLFGPTSAALEQAGLANHYVLVGVKSKGIGWENSDDGPVKAFMTEHALTAYPIDRRRVIGTGYSSGCWYINRFVHVHSELFAGAIGYVGAQAGPTGNKDLANVAELYWVMGHKDGLQPLAGPREQALKLIAAGFPVVYHEDRNMGHGYLEAPLAPDAMAWMQTLRVKPAPLTAEDQTFIEQYRDEAKAKKQLADARAWARLVAIGGPAVAPVLIQALAHEKPAVKTNAAIACSRIQLDDAVIAALVTQFEGKDTKVKGAVLGALVQHASWNRRAAQEALCAVAADAQRPSVDRRAVAQGIGQALKPDLLGAFVYRRMIWTLVDLLDDEDGGLRQIAALALEPSQTGGFGYQAGANKAGRAAAVASWKEWATKACGERPALP
jgi:predicted esterase